MVLDLMDAHGAKAANFALDFVERESQAKPWVFVEPRTSKYCLYPPSFSRELREVLAQKKILWAQGPEELCPKIALHWLNSSLCQGVLLHRLDSFSKAVPAGVWSRRWQLAGKKTHTHFIWLHEKDFPVIGFDLRLDWPRGSLEPHIKKGHHHFEKLKRTAA